MKTRFGIPACLALLACSAALADDVTDTDRMLCATSEAMLCFEDGECFSISILDTRVPQFLIVDTDSKTISTTEGSGEDRQTPVENMSRNEGLIFLQGIQNNRAFSIVIEELSGQLSAAIVRGGITLSIFGACTDADVK